MKSRTWMFSAAMFLFAALAITVQLSAQKSQITTFDVPGAGQGTFAWNIVQGGWIAGNYIDSSGVYHGFLRDPDGKNLARSASTSLSLRHTPREARVPTTFPKRSSSSSYFVEAT
jgi:hypothetical protein